MFFFDIVVRNILTLMYLLLIIYIYLKGITFMEGMDLLNESDAEFKSKVKEIMSNNPR